MLPNAVERFKKMVDKLATVTQQQVDRTFQAASNLSDVRKERKLA